MSLFHTKIAVDLKPILDAMPKGAVVHGISWDNEAGEIVILWEADRFVSPYTRPILFEAADLKAHRLPADVRDATKKIKVRLTAQPEPAPKEAPTEPVKTKMPDVIRAEEGFDAAVKAGEKLEVWGIESLWRDRGADEAFVEGFLYRKKVVDAQPVPA